MAAPKKKLKYSARQLTKFLKELAMEAETVDDEGEVITKGKALALLLFKKALGYTETQKVQEEDEEGRPLTILKETYHKPESWAIQWIFERLEGRVPQAVLEEKSGPTIAEKIRDITRAKANAFAQTTQTEPRESKHLEKPKK